MNQGAFLSGLLLSITILVSGCESRPSVETDVSSATGSEIQRDTPSATTQPPGRVEEIRRSERLVEAGELEEAADVLRRLLLADPNDVEALFRFANLEARRGNLDDAIASLEAIPVDHPEAGFAALGQAADWSLQAARYRDAESKYKQVLGIYPDAALAHRQLAYLFNRQGRRHEAALHVQQMCRIGDVREDELHTLMSLSDAVSDDVDATTSNPDDRSLAPIGASGEARRKFTERKYVEAAELLRAATRDELAIPAINAFYGRTLAEAQDERALLEWIQNAKPELREYAEYWAAVGTYLVEQQRFDEAVRALGEALHRDPTDARSYRRMHQALTALGQKELAKKWFDRYVLARNVTLASNRIGTEPGTSLDAFPELIDGLEKMGRRLEAMTWRIIEEFYRTDSPETMQSLRERRARIANDSDAFSSDSERLCGMRLDDYPIAALDSLRLDPPAPETVAQLTRETLPRPCFENVAGRVGLEHQFQVASRRQGSLFAVYQSFGGGVAVLDYDLDGMPDLYFAQGGCDPPSFTGSVSDTLYRSLSQRLLDVTDASGVDESQYTIGVTAGDWNQDGFPDLVIGNIGQNQMLINNGDGTFTASPTDAAHELTVTTTSLAIADVTGDHLPDLVELNYLDDPTLTKKPSVNEAGQVELFSILDFQPAMDRIHVNDGRGGRDVEPISDSESAKATGLGVVVGDFDLSPGNEIFVGNDVRADQLWKRTAEGKRVDFAPLAGCSLGSGGSTTASMGIAAADYDRSGTLDLYITNFENEPASLLLNRGKTFQERGTQRKLTEDSFAVLGFGCQPIDYANDGYSDIVVTNGHIEDMRNPKQPFAQPAQLFANLGDTFTLVDVQDPSAYFGGLHVGRSLTRLDFNRDGKLDFVVTHIEATSALLLNQTETANHWLQLELVGTRCERDAIGATVEVRRGEDRWTAWRLAGDGYLCRNEPMLHFGLGESNQAVEVRVVWPDGVEQTFANVPIDCRMQLVQGEQDVFLLSPVN